VSTPAKVDKVKKGGEKDEEIKMEYGNRKLKNQYQSPKEVPSSDMGQPCQPS